MHSMTSAMSHSAAVRTEFMRFSAASDEGRSDDRWLPTSTIGTGEFCTMKLRIAPVCAIVSVPWPMTMPSAPFSISSPMAMASALYCTGPMFSLNTPNSFFVVRFAMSASSGTAPYSSPGVNAGMTAPVR